MVELGSLHSAEQRRLILEADVPRSPRAGLAPICDLELRWVDVESMRSERADIPVHVNIVPGDEAAGRDRRPPVTTELSFQRRSTPSARPAEALGRRRHRRRPSDLGRRLARPPGNSTSPTCRPRSPRSPTRRGCSRSSPSSRSWTDPLPQAGPRRPPHEVAEAGSGRLIGRSPAAQSNSSNSTQSRSAASSDSNRSSSPRADPRPAGELLELLGELVVEGQRRVRGGDDEQPRIRSRPGGLEPVEDAAARRVTLDLGAHRVPLRAPVLGCPPVPGRQTGTVIGFDRLPPLEFGRDRDVLPEVELPRLLVFNWDHGPAPRTRRGRLGGPATASRLKTMFAISDPPARSAGRP